MNYHYAAIQRGYGRGIGQRISQLSGLPCHGGDILERAITGCGIPLEDAESTLQRSGRKRSRYYSANTGRDWPNYDLIPGTGACARTVLAAMRGQREAGV